MTTLGQIEDMTRQFAEARKALAAEVEELEAEISLLKKKHMPHIKKFVENAAEKKSRLHAAIEDAPEFFRQPRTFILHNIRFGYRKEKGRLIWEDKERVIKLIKKNFPDEWEVYVKVTESPLKTALEQLPAVELKKLGIQVTDDKDEVYIKSTDTEIDHLISALLKESEEVEGVEDAA